VDFVEILASTDYRKEALERNLRRANEYYLSFHWRPEYQQRFEPEVIRSWEWLLHLCQERVAARHAVDAYGGT